MLATSGKTHLHQLLEALVLDAHVSDRIENRHFAVPLREEHLDAGVSFLSGLQRTKVPADMRSNDRKALDTAQQDRHDDRLARSVSGRLDGLDGTPGLVTGVDSSICCTVEQHKDDVLIGGFDVCRFTWCASNHRPVTALGLQDDTPAEVTLSINHADHPTALQEWQCVTWLGDYGLEIASLLVQCVSDLVIFLDFLTPVDFECLFLFLQIAEL